MISSNTLLTLLFFLFNYLTYSQDYGELSKVYPEDEAPSFYGAFALDEMMNTFNGVKKADYFFSLVEDINVSESGEIYGANNTAVIFGESINDLNFIGLSELNFHEYLSIGSEYVFIPYYCLLQEGNLKLLGVVGEPNGSIEYCSVMLNKDLELQNITSLMKFNTSDDSQSYKDPICIASKDRSKFLIGLNTDVGRISKSLEYRVLDSKFKELTGGKIDFEANIEKEHLSDIGNLNLLNSGDPVLNAGGKIYFAGGDELVDLGLQLEQKLNSYQIVEDETGKAMIVGSYIENDRSGLAFISLSDDDLSAAVQNYTLTSGDFDIETNELHKKLSGISVDSVFSKWPPRLIKAKSFGDYTIVVLSKVNNRRENLYTPSGMNFDILKIDNKTGEILSEIVVPKKHIKMYNASALIGEDEVKIICKDYQFHYDESTFIPKLDLSLKQETNLKKVDCIVTVDLEKETIIHEPMIIESPNKREYDARWTVWTEFANDENKVLMTLKCFKCNYRNLLLIRAN